MTPMGMMGYQMAPAYPQGNAMLNAGLMNQGMGRRRPQGIQQKLRQQQNAQMLRMNMQGMNGGGNMGYTRNQRRAMNRQMAAMQGMQLQQQMLGGQQRGQQRALA
jgi:hypothetical protein